MTILQHLQVLAVVLMLAAGQLLFRKSALGLPPLASLDGLIGLATSPLFLFALAIYGVATLLWVGVLQQVPLSRAYGFMALGFVIVPLAAIFFLGETLTPRLAGGFVLIVAGLLLIGAKG